MSTYIDFHLLQLVPPSCINRDDTGSPKSATFGGVVRHRVSSQAWKKATRSEFKSFLDTEYIGERTKQVAERVAEQIRALKSDLTEEQALESAVAVLADAGIKMDTKKAVETSYLFFLSRSEIQAFADIAVRKLAGETFTKANVRKALEGTNAYDVALFGRMLADAPERNVDAACQVEHALSVHKATQEFDYFTAMDDNAPEDNAGAGMIGTTEFVSSTLYRYATINVQQLIKNLGDADAAQKAIEAFARAFTLSMPTGKQNSFANRTRPDFIFVEIREDQPVSLVNAFESEVPNNGNALELAAERLVDYATEDDSLFGTAPLDSFCMVSSRIKNDNLAEKLATRSTELSFPEIIVRAGAAVHTNEA